MNAAGIGPVFTSDVRAGLYFRNCASRNLFQDRSDQRSDGGLKTIRPSVRALQDSQDPGSVKIVRKGLYRPLTLSVNPKDNAEEDKRGRNRRASMLVS